MKKKSIHITIIIFSILVGISLLLFGLYYKSCFDDNYDALCKLSIKLRNQPIGRITLDECYSFISEKPWSQLLLDQESKANLNNLQDKKIKILEATYSKNGNWSCTKQGTNHSIEALTVKIDKFEIIE